jgi:tetratricopeptide (TPR) repeat protein
MILPAFLLLNMLDAQARVPAPQPPTTAAISEAYFLFVQGRVLDGKDDPTGAIASLKRAAELLPAAADIRAELAGVYARQGQVAEARSQAEQALVNDPNNRDAHRILGWIQAAIVERATVADAAMLTDAIGHLERALADGANDPSAQLTLSGLYVRDRQAAKAVALLTAFLEDHPGYPQALQLLGEAYDLNGQPAEAARVRASATVAGPAEAAAAPETPLSHVEVLEQKGQWKDAAAAWADIVRANPSDLANRLRYVVALANSNDVPAARQVLLDVVRESPKDPDAWFLLFQLEWRAGNSAAAEDAARHIVESAPDDPRGPMAVAGVRAGNNDYSGVIAALQPRVTAASTADLRSGAFTQMASQLSSAFLKQGNAKQAIAMLEGAQRKAPADRRLLFSLVNAYEEDRRYDRAEQTLRDLVDRDPADAEALNHLGYMLADRGQKLDEAVTLIKRALVDNADNPAFLDSLGWAYFKLTKLDAARPPLEQAAAALPTQSVIQEHLGDLYFQMKRYGDATTAFDRALVGDREDVDVAGITKKRDRAKSLADKR